MKAFYGQLAPTTHHAGRHCLVSQGADTTSVEMSGSLLQQSLRHLSRDPNEMSLAKVLGVGGEPSGSLATHTRYVVK